MRTVRVATLQANGLCPCIGAGVRGLGALLIGIPWLYRIHEVPGGGYLAYAGLETSNVHGDDCVCTIVKLIIAASFRGPCQKKLRIEIRYFAVADCSDRILYAIGDSDDLRLELRLCDRQR